MKTRVAQIQIKIALLSALLFGTALAQPALGNEVPAKKAVHRLQVTGPDGRPHTANIEISYIQPKTAADLAAAKRWLQREERQTPSQHRYIFELDGQKLLAHHPEANPYAGGAYSHHTISSELSEAFQAVPPKSGVERAVDKLNEFSIRYQAFQKPQSISAYDLTLGVLRAAGVGGAITVSFVSSGIEPQTAAMIGFKLGAVSGTIQGVSNTFGDWLERNGRTATFFKSTLGSTAYAAMAKTEMTHEEKEKMVDTLANKASYYVKWYGVEVVLLSWMYQMLEANGHFDGDLTSMAGMVLKSATLALISQGLWEEIFLKMRRQNIDSGKKTETMAKVSYSMRLFGLSVLTNGALAMSSIPEFSMVGDGLMWGMFAGGVGYYTMNKWSDFKASAKKALSNCASLLMGPKNDG